MPPVPGRLPVNLMGDLFLLHVMTVTDFLLSIETDATPPADLSEGARALWYAKAGDWHRAHNIAQDMPCDHGSWIHALLHLMEGDVGNAQYWFHRAKRSPVSPQEIDQEWMRIATAVLR
jgi:hypothetical protein